MPERPDPKLIRCCCDGELTPEQVAALEKCKCDPHVKQAVEDGVEYQKRLRECVGKAMKSQCQCAPEGLADSIRRSVFAGGGMMDGARQRSVIGRIFANPQRANFLAVAATIALIAGVVLYGIFGPTIDESRVRSPDDMVNQAALFASQAHDRQSVEDVEQAEIRKAELALSQRLGVPVEIPDLSELGYEFAGAAECDMQLPDRWAQLRYRSNIEGQTRARVSIFITPYTGRCGGMCSGMDPGKWKCASEAAKAKAECRHRVLYSRDQQLIYFLVCCKENDLEALTKHVGRGLRPNAGSGVR